MTRTPRYTRAVDVPPEMQSISTLNAYETGEEHVRIACQLSDAHNEIGELAILRISMTSMLIEVEDVFDGFSVAFCSRDAKRDILVETGGIVRLRTAPGWEMYILKAKFLLEAFSLREGADFVLGDEGEIFRFDGRSAWTQDAVVGSERLFAMHGTSSDRLYAVGRDGTLLKESGGTWEHIDVAIGTDFRCVLVEEDRVLVAGDRGVAGSLAGSEYVVFETGVESDILSVCSFRGTTYFSDSDFGVYRLVGNTFQPVANLGYTYRINAGVNWLTAACGEYIFQFNGSIWRGIEISYRGGYRAEPYDMSFME